MTSRAGAQQIWSLRRISTRSALSVLGSTLLVGAMTAPLVGCAEHHVSERDAAVVDAGGANDATAPRDVGPPDAGPPPVDLSYDWGLGPLDSDTSECPELVAEVYLETRPYPPAVTLVPGASIPCWTLGVVVDAPLAPLVTRVTGARCDARPGLGGTLCSFPGSNPLSEADYAFYCDVSALFPSAAWRCVIYLE